MLLERVVLVVDDRSPSVLRLVVIERSKLSQPISERGLGDPPIEINEVGMIFVYDLGRAGQPIVQKLRRNIRTVLIDPILVAGLDQANLRGPIESRKLWIGHIGIELPAAVEEPVVFGTMGG